MACTGATGDPGKEWLKRWVFKCFLKTDIDDADETFRGRVFHSRVAATGKARSPMVERRVRGTTSDDVDAERRRWQASSADDWWSSSARYGGAVWCRHFVYQTSQLKLDAFSSSATVSGVAWCGSTSMQKHKPSSSVVVAEFDTVCIRLVRWDAIPVSVALP